MKKYHAPEATLQELRARRQAKSGRRPMNSAACAYKAQRLLEMAKQNLAYSRKLRNPKPNREAARMLLQEARGYRDLSKLLVTEDPKIRELLSNERLLRSLLDSRV